jgi:hypothetical protein
VTVHDLDQLDQKAQAAALLARGMSSDKVGEMVGRSGRTIRRWAEGEDFQADVRDARRAILGEIADAVAAAARDAVEALHQAVKDTGNPAVRVRAATALLGALPAVREHLVLADQVAAIEAAAQEAGAA